jgi:hypothetical protein
VTLAERIKATGREETRAAGAGVSLEMLLRFFAGAGSPAIMEEIVTLAEQFREEGRAEAREKAHSEARAETLMMLLRTKFGRVPAQVSARVKAADAATLDRWLKRFVHASTLDEVLAD